MAVTRPRQISGSAGSRIKLILGETGSDYLYFFNEDDGNRQWQTRGWTTGSGGLPSGLARQLNNISAKERYVTYVSFGPNYEWFVTGEKRDGSGGHGWWGGTTASDNIKALLRQKGKLQVVFGDGDKHLLIKGRNGYSASWNVDDDLTKRMKRINAKKGKINFVRLFSDGGYFISDSEGTEWKGIGTPLSKELKNGGTDAILDVTVAGDGSWVVIRTNRFTSSKGVSSDLTAHLARFYREQKARQNTRNSLIAAYDAQVQREREEREEAERRAKEEKEQKEAEERRKREEEARMEAEHRRRLQKEERVKERRKLEDRLNEISSKRLRVGDRVTVAGFSQDPGDALIKSVAMEGMIKVEKLGNNSSVATIEDPRMLTVFDNREEDTQAIVLLCHAADKYEAAMSVFHCHCHGGVCECTKVFSAKVSHRVEEPQQWKKKLSLQQQQLQNQEQIFTVSQRVHVEGYADATVIENEYGRHISKQKVRVSYDDGTTYYASKERVRPCRYDSFADAQEQLHPFVMAFSGFPTSSNEKRESQTVMQVRPVLEHRGDIEKFDEYECAEKIDLKRLQMIRKDLQKDSEHRKNCAERLQRKTIIENQDSVDLKKLHRCEELEEVVDTLDSLLCDQLTDEFGYIVHEVKYEHRDPSFRGRLFAVGAQVKRVNDKFPRTATLQGMHSDLRAPLVGNFAYDVDCENSEVRLLCSLAMQLGHETLIPVLFDYRDNRQQWLSQIARFHGVSESDVKRLPNIILSGGQYETWLRAMDLPQPSWTSSSGKSLKEFVFKLYAQIRTFRDQLLHHPRFRWTSIDREKLKRDGKSDGAINTMMMSRIVQCCENEVLGIMHRHFFDKGWIVRAKVFDGLIAERGPNGTEDLTDVLRSTEDACRSRGWDVRLIEKPLRGKEDEPVKTIVDARRVVQNLDQGIRRAVSLRRV